MQQSSMQTCTNEMIKDFNNMPVHWTDQFKYRMEKLTNRIKMWEEKQNDKSK